MKTLVTYYSRSGNTKSVAQEISKTLDADIDEIIDATDRSGVKGWLYAGRDASKKNLTQISHKKKPADYDMVIIGTPIWAWTVCPAIRTYLNENSKNLKNVAFFCTMGGSGDLKAFSEMEKLSKKPVATLSFKAASWTSKLSLKKDKNLEKLKEFCEKIKKNKK